MKHIQRYRPQHPRASASGCILAHVEIAEKALGKLLPAGTHVHHVDENPQNNEPSNLVICQDAAYHKLLHVRTRIVRVGGNPNTQKLCCDCKTPKDFAEFNIARHNKSTGLQSCCRVCSKAREAIKRGRMVA